jgi:drug/metabolite transporter (DMT)-like permease
VSESDALRRANRNGILLMCATTACFMVNDALVKLASETMPTAQLIFVRGVMATAWILLVAHAMGATARLREAARGWVAGRAAVDAIASVIYLAGLFHLPLANATAINLASPLFITLLAVVFLGERVGWYRWGAIVAGFVGVLLVIQPRGDAFNAWSLLCLFASVLHAVRDLATRRIAAGFPLILVTLAGAVAVTLLSGAVSIFEGWRAFGLRELGILAGASMLLAVGYYCLIAAMREGEVSVVSPFRYTAILWAILLGWLVWGDTPNLPAQWGIALLIASGLTILFRERARGLRARRRPPGG